MRRTIQKDYVKGKYERKIQKENTKEKYEREMMEQGMMDTKRENKKMKEKNEKRICESGNLMEIKFMYERGFDVNVFESERKKNDKNTFATSFFSPPSFR